MSRLRRPRRPATRTRDQWFAELRDVELCVAPVLDVAEALADEHQRARGMVVEVDDAVAGRVREVGIGPKFSDTPGEVRTIAPAPGAQTDVVLSDLGFDAAKIANLRERNIVN